MKGRLKHSLKERCPVCNKVLQLRVLEIPRMNKGVEVMVSEERIFCSRDSCDYERYVEQKRVRRKDEEKTL